MSDLDFLLSGPPISLFRVPPALLTHITVEKVYDDSTDIQQPVNRKQQLPPTDISPRSTSTATCHECRNLTFENHSQQRDHMKTDWHRYNVKRNLTKHLPPVSEEEFEQLLGELSSISGSDTEEESDDDDSDANAKNREGDRSVQKLESLLRTTTVATSDDCEPSEENNRRMRKQNKTPIVWLPCSSDAGPVRVGVYRQVLKDTATGGTSESDSQLKLRTMALERLSDLSAQAAHNSTRGAGEARCWAVIMLSGGHFAGAVFDCLTGEPLVHKTFHRYTVRRKQGGGQSANDQAKGAAKSAGADLRRYNEQALRKDIQVLLKMWSDGLTSCELIFVHAPSANRRVLFGEGEAGVRSLDPGDPRIRNLPFTTKRPTVNELKRSFVELSTIKISRIDAASLAEAEDRRRPIPEPVQVRKTTESDRTPATPAEPVDEALEKLVDLARKGKTQALVAHLDKHSFAPDVPLPSSLVDARNRTLLHLAAFEGHAELVTRLLELGADPSAAGLEITASAPRRTAYELSKDKEVRNAFRRAMASMPDRWNWEAAKVPSPLTKEMEEEQERKNRERKKKERQKKEASRKAKPVRDATPVEEPKEAAATVRTKGTLSTLTRTELQASGLSAEARARLDREKRARAAELRMANMSGPKATTGTCHFCRKDLTGITPFERLQFRYCSIPCVQEHRRTVP